MMVGLSEFGPAKYNFLISSLSYKMGTVSLNDGATYQAGGVNKNLMVENPEPFDDITLRGPKFRRM